MRLPALSALLLLVAACQSRPAPAAPLSTRIFEDVPAPRGVTYLEANFESFSYQTPTFRCGRFLFDWQGAETDAVRFYRDTMASPPYNWTFAGEDRVEEGSTRLTFVKGEDRCTVDIDRVPKPGAEKRNNLNIAVRVNYRR